MKNILIVLFVLVLSSCNKVNVNNENTENKIIATNSNAENKTIPTEQWLNFMLPAIAASLCDDKNPIRSCFKINKSNCVKAALDAASTCTRIISKEIPESINNTQGYRFGGILGVCTAKAYAFFNKDLYIKNKPDCKKYKFTETAHNK